MAYAENTSVPWQRSRDEIESTLNRYGAENFMYGLKKECAAIAFTLQNRNIRFIVPFPDNARFSVTEKGNARSNEAAKKAYEQEIRRRWRALSLVIKAKLEAVQSGISEFEDEFLANIVLPNGATVSDEVRPRIEQTYNGNANIPLLPDMR